jgi:hypothetical protein
MHNVLTSPHVITPPRQKQKDKPCAITELQKKWKKHLRLTSILSCRFSYRLPNPWILRFAPALTPVQLHRVMRAQRLFDDMPEMALIDTVEEQMTSSEAARTQRRLRFGRATHIVQEGALEYLGGGRWLVLSLPIKSMHYENLRTMGVASYLVDVDAKSCTCQDHKERGSTLMCKHRVAVSLICPRVAGERYIFSNAHGWWRPAETWLDF